MDKKSVVQFSKWLGVIIFVVIMTMGGALRFYQLGTESLWFDEAFTLQDALEFKEKGTFYTLVTQDSFPPLYATLLSQVIKYAGMNEAMLRVLSALFGSISILLVYLCARLFVSEKTALLAAAIMAISPIQILYSQELRVYSLFVGVVLLSMYTFFQWFRTSKRVWLGMLCISNTIGLYTSYFFMYSLCFQFLYLLFQPKKQPCSVGSLYQWFGAISIAGLAYMPWLVTYFLPIQIYENHARVIASLIQRVSFPERLAQIGQYIFFLPLLIVPLMAVYASSLEKIFKRWYEVSKKAWNEMHDQKKALALMGIFVLSVTLFYGKQLASPIYLTRYPLFLIPFWYIFEASLIMSINTPRTRKMVGIALVITLCVPLITYYTTQNKEDWRGVAAYLQENADETSLILTTGTDVMLPLNYYFNNTIPQREIYSGMNSTAILKQYERRLKREPAYEIIKDALQGKKKVFLIVSHAPPIDGLLRFISNYSTAAEKKEFTRITLYVYTLNNTIQQ